MSKEKILIITQDNCPNCQRLKMYLEFGLQDKYKDQIQYVHKEKDPGLYNEQIDRFSIRSTPAIIKGNKVLREFSPLMVQMFLEEKE